MYRTENPLARLHKVQKPDDPNNPDHISWGQLISSLGLFTYATTIVEIGVQRANSTKHFCEAMKKTHGFVYGYDTFEPVGAYIKKPGTRYGGSFGSLEACTEALKEYDNFKLTKINTHSPEFADILIQDLGHKKIDIAFIDACHSYDGAVKDLQTVYPLLARTGIIVFHDTYSHVGLRKLNIDLRTKLYDGTYDVIELPFGRGNKRLGLTIVVKRSFALTNTGILNIEHDEDMKREDIYDYENNFLLNEIEKAKNND